LAGGKIGRREGVGLGQGSAQRREMILTGGAHLSVDEGEGEDTLSGGGLAGPGLNLSCARMASPRPFLLFLILFLFLNSGFIHIFCKFGSN
jgi:hypothetical protein